jgi:hypothetical protein
MTRSVPRPIYILLGFMMSKELKNVPNRPRAVQYKFGQYYLQKTVRVGQSADFWDKRRD